MGNTTEFLNICEPCIRPKLSGIRFALTRGDDAIYMTEIGSKADFALASQACVCVVPSTQLNFDKQPNNLRCVYTTPQQKTYIYYIYIILYMFFGVCRCLTVILWLRRAHNTHTSHHQIKSKKVIK